MTSDFRFCRLDAEHVAADLLGNNYAGPNFNYPVTKAHGHNNNRTEYYDWEPEAPLFQFEEDFGCLWEEKMTGLENTFEFDTNADSSDTDQALQHTALDRGEELAESMPHCDSPDQHYAAAENYDYQALPRPSTPSQGMAAEPDTASAHTTPFLTPVDATAADPAHALPGTNHAVEEASVAAPQEGPEAVAEVQMLTEDGTDEAADVAPVLLVDEAANAPNARRGGFNVLSLLRAYWQAQESARYRRRCTLSDAFQLLFPEHAAANLIPVPKNRDQRELIAILARDLQIKYGDSGRRGNGTGNERSMWTKLRDSLKHNKKPCWERYEDADYYFYYRV